MNWKTIDMLKVRSIILHCQNCGVITEATRSDGFKCEYCGECSVSSKTNKEKKWEVKNG